MLKPCRHMTVVQATALSQEAGAQNLTAAALATIAVTDAPKPS